MAPIRRAWPHTFSAPWPSLVALLALAALILQTSTTDVRICPPEPTLEGECPYPCTRCESGVCIIENPTRTVACPDNIPCRIVCFYSPSTELGKPCSGIMINCPQNASCDFRCTGAACTNSAITCKAGSNYSCTAQCDAISSLGSFYCDNSTACNCDNKCNVTRQCQRGFNCLPGEPCFKSGIWNDVCWPYQNYFFDKELYFDQDTQSCKCRCANASETLTIPGGTDDPTCVPTAAYCDYSPTCLPGGICRKNTCSCKSSFLRGLRCNETCSCNLRYLTGNSSYHVVGCDFQQDTCLCATGWTGKYCNISSPINTNCSMDAFEAYNLSQQPPVEAPVDAPAEAPIEAPVEAPLDVLVSPMDAPAILPLAPPTEAPLEAPVDPPVDAPAEAPADAPPVEPPADAPVAPPETVETCPLQCSYCDGDVCVITSIFSPNGWPAECPPGDFPCRIVCDNFNNYLLCGQVNRCGGDRPCEFVCAGPQCKSATFFCFSTISCTTRCAPDTQILSAHAHRPSAVSTPYLDASINMSCPIVDYQCPMIAPCIPGESCEVDDPCSSKVCYFGTTALLGPDGTTCVCRCPNGTISTAPSNPDGCRNMFIDSDCSPQCQNHGVCRRGRCYCPSGFKGVACEIQATEFDLGNLALVGMQRQTSSFAQRNCPTDCSFCQDGLCVISASQGTYRTLSCPQDWACLFICDTEYCAQKIICDGTAGPCTLMCIGEKVPSAFEYFMFGMGETDRPDIILRLTPSGNCAQTTLICNTTFPCGATCTNGAGSVTNQIYDIRCQSATQNTNNESAMISNEFGADLNSIIANGTCWIDSSCVEVDKDPCFIRSKFSYYWVCPTTANGYMMLPGPTRNSTGHLVCDCFCPKDFKVQNFTNALGKEDYYCVPAQGCMPECLNGGLCVYTDEQHTRTRCDCFSGYSGKQCESRCFFPIEANITSCDNGVYVIEGDLTLPSGRQLNLFNETENLIKLNVTGGLYLGTNSSLTLSPSQNQSTVPVISIEGQYTQPSQSVLKSEITLISGAAPLATQFIVSGSATIDGEVLVQFNATTLAEYVRTHGVTEVDIMRFQSLSSSTLVDGAKLPFEDTNSDISRCAESVVIATTRVQGSRLSVVFSLESNPLASSAACAKNASGDSLVATAVGVALAIVVVATASAGTIYFVRARKAKLERQAMMQKIFDTQSANSPQPSTLTKMQPSPSQQPQPLKWKRAQTNEVELRNMDN